VSNDAGVCNVDATVTKINVKEVVSANFMWPLPHYGSVPIQLLHNSSYYTINLIQVESEKKNDAKFVGAELTFVS
jgi:hypothetical protein